MKLNQAILDEATSSSTWMVVSDGSEKLFGIHTVEQFYVMHGTPQKKSTKFKIRYARKMVKKALGLDDNNFHQTNNEKPESDVQWVGS